MAAKGVTGERTDDGEQQPGDEADCVEEGNHKSRWLVAAD
jgi:hypothetical protein